MSQIGNSLFDAPGSEKVAALLEKAKKNNVKVVFPVDYITADKFDKDANVRFTGVILWFVFALTRFCRLVLLLMRRVSLKDGWVLTQVQNLVNCTVRPSWPRRPSSGTGAYDSS